MSGAEAGMLAITIPTAGNRMDQIESIIESSLVPRSNVIIVATRPGIPAPSGCELVQDLGAVNIQRWWNRGIARAKELGAEAVAVLNDDIDVQAGGLGEMHRQLMNSSADIASPSRPEIQVGVHRRRLAPYRPVLWGACWIIKAQSQLRPDERYRWWYGDNDLDIRARKDHGGVLSVPVKFQHLASGEQTGASEALQALALQDEARFEYQYRHLLRVSRAVEKWGGRFGWKSDKS